MVELTPEEKARQGAAEAQLAADRRAANEAVWDQIKADAQIATRRTEQDRVKARAS